MQATTTDDFKIAIITSGFYADLATQLTADAQAVFPNSHCFDVSGVFELPLITQRVLRTGVYAGAVCLGLVIQGETPHFSFVARAATEGITRVSLDLSLPIAFGVLTTDTYEQAVARVHGPKDRKGHTAALALKTSLLALEKLQ